MATTNPFERPDALYRVLVNRLGQHSLWPAGAVRPAGWTTRHGPADRDDCLQWIDANWVEPVDAYPVAESSGRAGDRDEGQSQP